MSTFSHAADWAGSNVESRVAFLTALRAEVGKRATKNAAGAPLVSDWDLLTAQPDEIEAAIAKADEIQSRTN